MKRIFAHILIIFSIFYLPYFITIILLLLSVFFFLKPFYGVYFYTVFSDLLYGLSRNNFFHFSFFISIILVIIFTIILLYRDRIRLSYRL